MIENPASKTCVKCGTQFSAIRCAECKKAYYQKNRELACAKGRARYVEKREEILASAADWRAKNPEKYKQRLERYAISNAEGKKASAAKWRAKNREDARFRAKLWREKNPDKTRQKSAEYRANNADRIRVSNRNRKERTRGAGKLSPGIIEKLLVLQKGQCACCKCSVLVSGYHLDHIHPLAKGGSNTDENVQILCPQCNMAKHDKLPHEFMQSRGFLL